MLAEYQRFIWAQNSVYTIFVVCYARVSEAASTSSEYLISD